MFEVKRTDAFDGWLKGLKDAKGRARIQARIDRLANGNPGDVAPIREGLSELRIDFGRGYRGYYSRAHAMWKELKPLAEQPAKKK